MGILITILALGFVIFIHELGHMLVAKFFGVGVHEFSIGMGPAVLKKKLKETLYALRVLPFGGFVKLAGLDDSEETPSPDDQNFLKKPIYQRFCVLAAGSSMNILLGFCVILCLFAFWGKPVLSPTINGVVPNSPAFQAGLLKGDKLLAINNLKINDMRTDVIKRINQSEGVSVKLDIEREGQLLSLHVIPTVESGTEKPAVIGILLQSDLQRGSLFQVVGWSLDKTSDYIGMVFTSIHMLVTAKASVQDMAGPIGIVQYASFELNRSLVSFLNIIALISISLGVINLFPFPVLDGGHILFLLIEWVTKKPVSKPITEKVTQIGALALMLLMGFIVFNDINTWASRKSLLESFR